MKNGCLHCKLIDTLIEHFGGSGEFDYKEAMDAIGTMTAEVLFSPKVFGGDKLETQPKAQNAPSTQTKQ